MPNSTSSPTFLPRERSLSTSSAPSSHCCEKQPPVLNRKFSTRRSTNHDDHIKPSFSCDDSSSTSGPTVASPSPPDFRSSEFKPSSTSKSYKLGPVPSRRRMPYSLGDDPLPPVPDVKACLEHCEEKNLNESINELYQRLLPTPRSEELRQRFVKKLNSILNSEWPDGDYSVHVFGSSGNLLCTSDSDVDICILTSIPNLQCVSGLAEVMARHGMQRIVCVASAKVPIVKIWDPELNLASDMNVNNPSALDNTQMVKAYVQLDERVRPLAMIIKYWTKRRILNDAASGGTLSSYTWICMIIYFLQTRDPPVLPVLHQLSHKLVYNSDGVECGFSNEVENLRNKSENKASLAQLLFEFFRFYGHEFEYDRYVVSVRQGRLLSRDEKGWNSNTKDGQWRLCVEEPMSVSRNLSNSADAYAFRGIHLELRRAFTCLADGASLEKCCAVYEFPPEEKATSSRKPYNGNSKPATYYHPNRGAPRGNGTGGNGGRNNRSSTVSKASTNFQHHNTHASNFPGYLSPYLYNNSIIGYFPNEYVSYPADYNFVGPYTQEIIRSQYLASQLMLQSGLPLFPVPISGPVSMAPPVQPKSFGGWSMAQNATRAVGGSSSSGGGAGGAGAYNSRQNGQNSYFFGGMAPSSLYLYGRLPGMRLGSYNYPYQTVLTDGVQPLSLSLSYDGISSTATNSSSGRGGIVSAETIGSQSGSTFRQSSRRSSLAEKGQGSYARSSSHPPRRRTKYHGGSEGRNCLVDSSNVDVYEKEYIGWFVGGSTSCQPPSNTLDLANIADCTPTGANRGRASSHETGLLSGTVRRELSSQQQREESRQHLTGNGGMSWGNLHDGVNGDNSGKVTVTCDETESNIIADQEQMRSYEPTGCVSCEGTETGAVDVMTKHGTDGPEHVASKEGKVMKTEGSKGGSSGSNNVKCNSRTKALRLGEVLDGSEAKRVTIVSTPVTTSTSGICGGNKGKSSGVESNCREESCGNCHGTAESANGDDIRLLVVSSGGKNHHVLGQSTDPISSW